MIFERTGRAIQKSPVALDSPPPAALSAMSASSDEEMALAAVANTRAQWAGAANRGQKRPHSDNELSDEPLVRSLLPSDTPLF